MSCDKCQNGLVPFVKNGKVISCAFVDCNCKQPKLESYHRIGPSDYDFPMSGTFRAHSYQYCSQLDPGYVPLGLEAPLPQEIIHGHSDMSKKYFARLQNLEGQVKYLQGKLTEREQKRAIRYEDYE